MNLILEELTGGFPDWNEVARVLIRLVPAYWLAVGADAFLRKDLGVAKSKA
jgi:hypothetical protein